MLDRQQLVQESHASRYSLSFAATEGEIEEAQQLRYKVFAEEMGARLATSRPGYDVDIFDRHCSHLLVREKGGGEVVGTYRILSPQRAENLGGYYSETEFDLTRLNYLRDSMVEVGRSCVHAEHRSGAVITLLWRGLTNYMKRGGFDYMIGCASISMADGGHFAASIYNQVKEHHMSPVEWRAAPRCPLPLEALDGSLNAALPPLIKGYLRVGSWVCGEPAWDPDFNTADLLVMLSMKNMSAAYARRLIGG